MLYFPFLYCLSESSKISDWYFQRKFNFSIRLDELNQEVLECNSKFNLISSCDCITWNLNIVATLMKSQFKSHEVIRYSLILVNILVNHHLLQKPIFNAAWFFLILFNRVMGIKNCNTCMYYLNFLAIYLIVDAVLIWTFHE